MRMFNLSSRFMELALYFETAFTQDPGRLATWRKNFEADLKKIKLPIVPLPGHHQGDYQLDPEKEESEIGPLLQRVGWVRISPKAFLYEKTFPNGGTFRIQLKRWKAERGKVKDFKDRYDDSTTKTLSDWEKEQQPRYNANYDRLGIERDTKTGLNYEKGLAKKKFRKDQEMREDKNPDAPARTNDYNAIKYDEPVEVFAILELTSREEQKPTSMREQKALQRQGLDKESLFRPNRDPNLETHKVMKIKKSVYDPDK